MMYSFLLSPNIATHSSFPPPPARFAIARKFYRLRSAPIRRARMAATARSSVDSVEWLMEPVLVKGEVQRGFGRGSRDLGTPTANLPGKLLTGISATARDGVYVGFGNVPKYSAAPIKMVANLGHNITYGDVPDRILEAFLMGDNLPTEFYGAEMRLCIIGYLRPELKFDSIQDLIEGINNDVTVAKKVLDDPNVQQYRKISFFSA